MAIGKLTSISYKFEEEPVSMCFDIKLNGKKQVLALDFDISCRCEAVLVDYTEFKVDKIGVDLRNIELSLDGNKVNVTEQEKEELEEALTLKISFLDCFFVSNYDCYFNSDLVAEELVASKSFKGFLEDAKK